MTVKGGMGVEIKIEISSTQTVIVDMKEGDPPEFEKFLAELTPHNAAGGYAQHVATGKRKINEIEIVIGWDRDEVTHAALLTAFDSDDPVNMEIITPDSDETLSGAAHIFKIGRVTDEEDAYLANVSIQPTGQWTIT